MAETEAAIAAGAASAAAANAAASSNPSEEQDQLHGWHLSKKEARRDRRRSLNIHAEHVSEIWDMYKHLQITPQPPEVNPFKVEQSHGFLGNYYRAALPVTHADIHIPDPHSIGFIGKDANSLSVTLRNFKLTQIHEDHPSDRHAAWLGKFCISETVCGRHARTKPTLCCIGLSRSIPFTQCQTWISGAIDFSLAKEDHRPLFADVSWTHQIMTVKLSQRPRRCQVDEFDGYALSAISRGIGSSFHLDVHTHAMELQDQIMACHAADRGPKRKAAPDKQSIPTTTWDLIQHKRNWRRSLADQQQLQKRTILAATFAGWRFLQFGSMPGEQWLTFDH
eukprot:s1067_g10.t1